MLKRMALSRNEAMKLEKMMLARGELYSNIRGMMGRSCCDSTYRHAGKHTPKMTSEAMTSGCVPFQC